MQRSAVLIRRAKNDYPRMYARVPREHLAEKKSAACVCDAVIAIDFALRFSSCVSFERACSLRRAVINYAAWPTAARHYCRPPPFSRCTLLASELIRLFITRLTAAARNDCVTLAFADLEKLAAPRGGIEARAELIPACAHACHRRE